MRIVNTEKVGIITLMNYEELTKKFSFQVPSELEYEDLRAKTLTRADLKADMEGVNSSLEIIRKTRVALGRLNQ